MTKTFYFYGCSLTAGDELSDGSKEFPFKLGETEDYFVFRNDILSDVSMSLKYQGLNKTMAFPAVLQKKYNIPTVNLAENGMSLRHIINKIMLQLADPSENIEHIFLQIPATGRELFINSKIEASIQLTQDIWWDADVNHYRKAKAVSHNDLHLCTEDITDLILLDGFLKSKNIPYTLIDIDKRFEYRISKLMNSRYYWMRRYFNKFNIYNYTIPEGLYTLGFHLTHEGHIDFAEKLKSDVIDKL